MDQDVNSSKITFHIELHHIENEPLTCLYLMYPILVHRKRANPFVSGSRTCCMAIMHFLEFNSIQYAPPRKISELSANCWSARQERRRERSKMAAAGCQPAGKKPVSLSGPKNYVHSRRLYVHCSTACFTALYWEKSVSLAISCAVLTIK